MIVPSGSLAWALLVGSSPGYPPADQLRSIAVAPESMGATLQPSVAVDAKGTVHVAFGALEERGIFLCSMGAVDEAFGKPVLIARTEHPALGSRRGPRLVATEKALVVSFVDSEDLVAFSSKAGGKTWKGPSRINRTPKGPGEGLHAMAAAADGTIYAVWLEHPRGRSRGQEPLLARSTDEGQSWGEPVRVYDPPGESICECCHPSAAVDREGRVHVMFRNSLKGKRNMYSALSKDEGKTFAEAEKLGKGNWTINACPMDGGAVAVTSEGKVFTAWRREGTVYFTGAKAGEEIEVGPGKNPWIAAAGKTAYLAWEGRNGLCVKSLESDSLPLQVIVGDSRDAVIATSPSGDTVFAAWDSREGERTVRIRGTFLRRGK